MRGWVQFHIEANNGYRASINLPAEFAKHIDFISRMTMLVDGAPIVSLPFRFHPGGREPTLHTLCRFDGLEGETSDPVSQP